MNALYKQTFRNKVQEAAIAVKQGRPLRETMFVDKFTTMRSRSSLYCHIPVYFNEDECLQIKQLGTKEDSSDWEPINFDGMVNRFQKVIAHVNNPAVADVPVCVKQLLELFVQLHPTTTNMQVALLFSKSVCPKQGKHTDDGYLSSSGHDQLRFEDASFSLLIALECNTNPTYLYIYKGAKEPYHESKFLLKQGSILLYRGDFPHSGAEYDHMDNTRFFITTGTDKYPHDGVELGVL